MIFLLYFYIASVLFALGVTLLEIMNDKDHALVGLWVSFIPIVNLFAIVYFL